MGPFTGPLVLIISAVVQLASGSYIESLAGNTIITPQSHGPMVAFMCNKGAMHWSKGGWEADTSTDCLRDGTEILNYCKKMYPDLKFSNIVEASYTVTIDNWCKKGHKRCKHHSTHTVRPYRCIVGKFESDPLLVPEHCVFQHIHTDAKERCDTFKSWNNTAKSWCTNNTMAMQSSAMLLPCGIDVFSGVEFVCCPLNKATPTPRPVKQKPPKASPVTAATRAQKKADELDKYMHMGRLAQYYDEHARFDAASKQRRKNHHDKVTKVMKDWASARQRILELKETDPKAAEKMNKEVTGRFQKTYQALESEGLAEKHQLDSVHQNHVQANLNSRKRKTIQKYMNALQEDIPDGAKILKGLKAYIRAEEKDRYHTLNHYKHLLDTDPEEAGRVHDHGVEHLKQIKTRVNEAVDMLERVPQLQKKVANEIHSFMKLEYGYLDKQQDLVMPPTPQPPFNIQKPKDKVKEKTYKSDAVHIEVESIKVAPLPKKKETLPKVTKPKKYDDEIMENEHDAYVVETKKDAHFGMVMNNEMDVQVNKMDESSTHASVGGNSAFGIALGCVAVVIIIVLAIVIVKKRARRVPVNAGFVEVDQQTPEERHVSNMQMNGYENPTYRYFEIQT